MPEIKKKIGRFRELLEEIEKKGIDISKKTDTAKSFYDFKERKQGYYTSSVEGIFNDLKKEVQDIASQCRGQDAAVELLILWKEIEKNKSDPKKTRELLAGLEQKASKISLPKKAFESISVKAPKIPAEIKDDVAADLDEIEKCFNNGLYRSATILCGRVLEAALHRKYYEATGQDILEKSPGIGLGNLIAKLKEKNIEIDPALTQQIHLINNVRIFSVHKKQEAFMPSKDQAHAIILYTVDVLKKMWG
ncbi:MAG TPA: DUF4145 domain-containing protein [Candidatus Nanoarchaeia archaeon]|nr:DUF4145 domain-containing protein [Candidatus Nanoarchaeia archaeon]